MSREASFTELKSAVLDPSERMREVVADAPRLANVVAGLESDRHNILAAFDVLLENLDSAKHLDRTETDVLMERLTAYRQRAADLLYQAYGVDLGGET
jgi:hypothetical protein